MKKAKRPVKKIALGTGISLLAYLTLLALLALLVEHGTVGEGNVWACVCAFAAFAAFVGVKTAAWGVAEPLSVNTLCATSFWLLVLLLGFLTNDGLDTSRAALLALPVLVGGGLAYLTKGGEKRRGKRRRHSQK